MKIRKEQVDYHRMDDSEKDEAIQFCIKVYAQTYGENATPTPDFFAKALQRPGYKDIQDFYGAYVDGVLAGVVGMRTKSNYMSLFYIDVNFQGSGLARIMFESVVKEYATKGPIYGLANYTRIDMYKHFGFTPTDDMHIAQGFKFIPVVYFKLKDFLPSSC